MDASLTTRVPGTPSGIASAAGELERFCGEHGLAATAVWPFHLALDEVLSNTVRCGYGGLPGEHQIELSFRLSAGELELVVVDDGQPFNPLDAPEPETGGSLQERAVGGLGLLLVRRLMDEVRYERAPGRNVLTLRRRLAA